MMRKRSKKMAAIYREFRKPRQDFLVEMGYCALCGDTRNLAVHEMTSGPNRMRGFQDRHTWLATCSICNCITLTDKKEWPVEKQLALKFFSDPEWFSISVVEDILGRNLDSDLIKQSIGRLRVLYS